MPVVWKKSIRLFTSDTRQIGNALSSNLSISDCPIYYDKQRPIANWYNPIITAIVKMWTISNDNEALSDTASIDIVRKNLVTKVVVMFSEVEYVNRNMKREHAKN